MAKITAIAMQEVEKAFRRYEATVLASKLRPNASKTYLLHANNFVRWLKDDFEPGATLR